VTLSVDVDTNLDMVLDVETVRPLIAALPERQRTVLSLRFFENLTQTQIADRIGCSQMHVSRLLAQALGTLRGYAREPNSQSPDKYAASLKPGSGTAAAGWDALL